MALSIAITLETTESIFILVQEDCPNFKRCFYNPGEYPKLFDFAFSEYIFQSSCKLHTFFV